MTLPKVHSVTGSGKAGPQRAEMVECATNPKNHGFHPANEACPWCEDPPEEYTLPTQYHLPWWMAPPGYSP